MLIEIDVMFVWKRMVLRHVDIVPLVSGYNMKQDIIEVDM